MNADISKEIKPPLSQKSFSSSRRTDEVPSKINWSFHVTPTQNAEEMRCYLWQ